VGNRTKQRQNGWRRVRANCAQVFNVLYSISVNHAATKELAHDGLGLLPSHAKARKEHSRHLHSQLFCPSDLDVPDKNSRRKYVKIHDIFCLECFGMSFILMEKK